MQNDVWGRVVWWCPTFAWHDDFGGQCDEPLSHEICDRAWDAGIDFFDARNLSGSTHGSAGWCD